MAIEFIPLAKDHIEIIREWRNSESISKFMYTDDVISSEQQIKWFEKISNDSSQKYWIVYNNSEPVGQVSLYLIKPRFKTCYWAYYIGNENAAGTGIGAKIEFKLLNYVFDEMKFNKLCCEVFVFNESVIRLHEKFGFRREGYFRQHIFKNNQYLDVVSMALLKSEWDIIKIHYSKILNR
jgi:UDP-4-amino-4,6-dideoxy-N-acetyl-beta-L-altrosamine N-acetyltransferase